jgi:ribonuclease P protein component
MDENTSTSALLRLKERKDFLAAAKGRKAGSGTLSLQGRRRLGHESDKADPSSIRIGFTCSKRVGNAVARNRARRRLKAAAAEIAPALAATGCDYVLIGRPQTIDCSFGRLKADMRRAFQQVTAKLQDKR